MLVTFRSKYFTIILGPTCLLSIRFLVHWVVVKERHLWFRAVIHFDPNTCLQGTGCIMTLLAYCRRCRVEVTSVDLDLS